MKGISQWDHEIPLSYMLLISGQAEVCLSSVWQTDQPIALVGDYAQGVAALTDFFEQMKLPEMAVFQQEALDFLALSSSKADYFVLEAAEIYDLIGDDMALENQQVLAEVNQIDQTVSGLAEYWRPLPQKQHWFKRLTLQATPSPEKMSDQSIRSLGLGVWTDELAYDFSSRENGSNIV